jgi:Zn-dependent peptidase ImmA (M78 family)
MTITDHRKKKISERADYLSEGFSSGSITDLAKIAANEELPLYYDHYEDSFDGMLLHDGRKFHIHINVDKGNTPTTKRGRFSLAHEYGHYFINEHRLGLKYGLLEAHASINSLNHKELIELEADYFASCLLMPFVKYKAFTARKDFSFDLISSISDHFQASLMATILRFIEAGTREFMVVISKKGLVKWFAKSKDFPSFAFRFKVGQAIPAKSLTAAFYTQNSPLIQSLISDRDPEDWFWINDNRANNTFYEQYFYSDINDYLVTLLWFK